VRQVSILFEQRANVLVSISLDDDHLQIKIFIIRKDVRSMRKRTLETKLRTVHAACQAFVDLVVRVHTLCTEHSTIVSTVAILSTTEVNDLGDSKRDHGLSDSPILNWPKNGT
jgi:hypothetical protein